jgi:hypothetical protein
MTEAEIDSLDHLDDPDYWEYGLSDEGILAIIKLYAFSGSCQFTFF